MKRVYTLYRVSTKKQINKSDNHENDIPLQKGACHEFLKYKPEWQITKEFEEKGISGYKVSAKDRDAIIELQDAAMKKEFDILLVFMFDRIGRIDDETPFIVEWFAKHNIEVWSVKEGQQRFDSHVDKLTNYIRFWQASGESEKTSIRIKERLKQLRLMGIYTGGKIPYGYRLVPSGVYNRKNQELKRYEIDLEQYIVLRKVIQKTINNGTGSYIMAEYLNSQGYTTANGKLFRSSTVIRILKSPLLRGLTDDNETSEALQKLRIITEEEATQIDIILKQRAQADDEKRQISMRTKGAALLSGNFFCAHCGGRMTTTYHKDQYTRKDGSEYLKRTLKYRCYHKANKLCDCDGQTTYDAKQVDEAILQITRQIFSNMKGAPCIDQYEEMQKKQKAAYTATKKKLAREIDRNKVQLDVLRLEISRTLVGDSIYSPEDLQEAMRVLKDRIDNAEEKLNQIDNDISDQQTWTKELLPTYSRFKNWAEIFDETGLEHKKMIICHLFERIEIGKDYNITVKINATYGQFCSEYNISNDNLKVAVS